MFDFIRDNRRVRTRTQMDEVFAGLAQHLLRTEPFDRGEVHAQRVTDPSMHTLELTNVVMCFGVDEEQSAWAEVTQPNLPWAEDHFQERVSGEPLNPPPSNEWWPFAQSGNAVHKKDEKFSHTYPERFWPKYANVGGLSDEGRQIFVPHVGIRFTYGDLEDLVETLISNPRTRQAYLPIWFPEDGRAARKGERVPCTLGYHFLLNREGRLDVSYFMRSCDLVRFWRDDVYMAGRLLQWVSLRTGLRPGTLRLTVSNLHAFQGDTEFLTARVEKMTRNPRADYDWSAML